LSDHRLDLGADFDEDEWLIETKGWYTARLTHADHEYELNFYDPVRLGQTIESGLESAACFFEHNLIVVCSVTRASMEKAVANLLQSGALSRLRPEPKRPTE
jgi:hypothetical protein